MQQANRPATNRRTFQIAASSPIPFLVRYDVPTSATGRSPSQIGLQ
jgi:hypothetical protein